MIDCLNSDRHYRELIRKSGFNDSLNEAETLRKFGFTDKGVESILLGEIIGKPKPLEGGSNEVLLVLLKSGNAGIFKPGKGEASLWEQHYQTEFKASKGKLFQRERAAYLVSQILGFNIVPTTVIREVDGEIGSFQQFIPGCEDWNQWWWSDENAKQSFSNQQLFLMAIFDYIIWNKDRKSANLLKKGRQMFAIDHGLSFDPWEDSGSRESHLESFVYNVEPPQEFLEKFFQFMKNESIQIQFWRELEEIIPREAIKAMLARMKLIELSLDKYKKIKKINQLNYHPGKS